MRYKEWGDADTHTFAKNANVWGTRHFIPDLPKAKKRRILIGSAWIVKWMHPVFAA